MHLPPSIVVDGRVVELEKVMQHRYFPEPLTMGEYEQASRDLPVHYELDQLLHAARQVSE